MYYNNRNKVIGLFLKIFNTMALNIQKKGGQGNLVCWEYAAHKLLRDLGANGGYLGFYYAASAIVLVMKKEEKF